MSPLKWRAGLLAGLLCFCLAIPFNADGSKQSPPAAGNASPQNATENPPAANQPSAAPNAAASTPAAKTATAAPQSKAAYESATVLRVTTRLVMVDVVATDSHGHAVLDLEPKDFTLLEDNKQQTVRVFGLQKPRAADVKVSLPALPANVFTNIPRFQLSSSLNVLLLDALNTPLTSQVYVRQKMLHYIETMPNDSPTAVYMLGQKLRMVQDFTTDPNILREAVKKAGSRSSPLLDNPTTGEEVEMYPPGFFDDLPAEAQAAVQSFEAERTSFQTDLRVRYTMDALQSIAHWLAGYQGRKNLVWISGSFPLSIDANATVSDNVEFGAARSYGNDIAKTAAMLTDSQIAIYPVDAGGLASSSLFSASNTGADRFGRRRMTGPQVASALSLESNNQIAAHDSMNLLAERTGGRAYYNRNDIDGAVRDGVSDGSTYYMLGYYPDNKQWDGKFRKVQVKVNRSGIKLRYRLGYYAADPQAYAKENDKQRARELADAMSLEHPVSTALFFQAAVQPPSEQSKNKVIVLYAIDSHALVVEHGDDGAEHADIECVVEAFNEKGKPMNSSGSTVNAAMNPETYKKVQQAGFPCRTEIALPEGNYLLRLGVRDLRTGLIGTANAKINVAKLVESKPEEKKEP
jgi:VWFA-related protein